jgi:large subunit ribosomal protein L30
MATKKKDLSIKLVRGLAPADQKQTRVLQALGLRRSKQVVEHDNSATIQGMINKVAHLVEVIKN